MPRRISILKAFSLAGLLLCALQFIACENMAGRAPAAPAKVLFIGNSYTAQIKGALLDGESVSGQPARTFGFITRGGSTLREHLGRKEVIDQIQTGDWDVVVLQEQSQTPALSPETKASFDQSVDKLVQLIRGAGAEPMLYMTWGRRDGDHRNPEAFPDYATMQEKISRAYRKAAARNRIAVAPVGEAWSIVRKKDNPLGERLYQQDGSHPSAIGAYLASCVFMHCLYGEIPESLRPPEGLDSEADDLIRDAARRSVRQSLP